MIFLGCPAASVRLAEPNCCSLAFANAIADLGVLLVDLFSVVADSLTTYQDAAAAEAYLGSACDPPC
jgi:hypothetical protein